MNSLRKYIRVVSAFLLINFLFSTFLPTISYALTSGPTAPEATSFEPIDTTDMVNLQTGDFTYNIPLLEVPGPSGGYPLSLSYHAGIQPNEEASWVGLGWSLNPGAITRNVSGYPDDFKNKEGSSTFYWEGGETNTYTIGVSVGVANAASVSAGLSFSQDTYRGFGMGISAGAGVGVELGSVNVGINGQVGISPYGGSYAGAGINIGIGSTADGSSITGNIGVGISTSGTYASGGVGISTRNKKEGTSMHSTLLGTSISSGNPQGSLTFAGSNASVHNSKAGNISTSVGDNSVDIPTPVPGLNIRLGWTYQRYWIHETEYIQTYGSLFYPNNSLTNSQADNRAYDTYDLVGLDLYDAKDPVTVLEGSFPDYDKYFISAQGLNGNIRPYHFRKNLSRQNQKIDGEEVYKVQHFPLDQVNSDVEFRFENDFSNRYNYSPDNILVDNSSGSISYVFDEPTITGETGTDGIKDNHLAGSKHIDWYTNQDIEDGIAKSDGFIDTQSAGFNRLIGITGPGFNDSRIGGFKITNESGVTYHYALPVYAFEEYNYSENINTVNGESFSNNARQLPYAYTWYLTAITGPDYVDRNGDGFANGDDWGYWLTFEYGKWASNYRWRNPSEGFHKDIDRNFQTFSKGQKELYYLNYVKSKTHTAVFVKEIRADGKSANPDYKLSVLTNPAGNSIEWKDLGNYSDRTETFEYFHDCEYNQEDDTPEEACNSGSFNYSVHQTSVLGLKEIYLFKNKDFQWESLRSESPIYDHVQNFTYPSEFYGQEDETISIRTHYGNNVVDVHDVSAISDFHSTSVSSILLNTDYSLCKNVPNSNFTNQDVENTGLEADEVGLHRGKFTLNSIKTYGKSKADLVPPVKFYYEKNPDYNKDAFDIWGLYKSDYSDNGNEDVDRMVTKASSENIDAWSLSKIKSATGAQININYESDTYHKSVLSDDYSIKVSHINSYGDSGAELTSNNSLNFSKYLEVGDHVKILMMYRRETEQIGGCTEGGNSTYGNPMFLKEDLIVTNVTNNTIRVENQDLYDVLTYANWHYGDPPLGGQTECDPYVTNEFLVANIAIENLNQFGGGLRVQSIELQNAINRSISRTTYEYNSPLGYSSGVTSFEPSGINNFHSTNDDELDLAYKSKLGAPISKLLSYSREIPGPGVMYEYVTVKESMEKNGSESMMPSYSTSQFEVFEESMFVISNIQNENTNSISGNYSGNDFQEIKTRAIAFEDNTSRVGNLKSITLYDSENNPLSKTENNYLHESLINYRYNLETKFKSQGLIEETFSDARIVETFPGVRALYGIISKRNKYPNILTTQTTTNYKTGISTTTENLAFDFYSGAVTKTKTTDGYGNIFVSETTPAYRKYGGEGGMGLAINGGKNMLTQTAANYTYKVDVDGNREAIVSADIQTWKNQWKYRQLDGSWDHLSSSDDPHPVWRKHKSFSYLADGYNAVINDDGLKAYNSTSHPVFASWSPEDDYDATKWQKNSEITLYNRYSHALEAKDVNGHYAATKMDRKEEKVFATVANAAYNEFAFSGAEETASGGIYGGVVYKGGNSTRYTTTESNDPNVHTGWASLKVDSGDKAFEFTAKATTDRQMKVSVWSSKGDGVIKYKLNGGATQIAAVQSRSSGSWYLLTANLPMISKNDQLQIWCAAGSDNTYFDDFRVHPLNAPMTAYVYNEYDELAFVLDNNNLYTEYKYDDMGRLESTYRESFKYGRKKVSEYSVHYSTEPTSNK